MTENRTVAALDLGTNMFQLCIAKREKGQVRLLHREKREVLIGEGIASGQIIPSAFGRGMDALKAYAEIIQRFNVDEIKGFGTSAFRTASNGGAFIERALEEANVPIQCIPGSHEAFLIHQAAMWATKQRNFPEVLIMDIGGGSVEYIFSKHGKIEWLKSLPLGTTRLQASFPFSDPPNMEEWRRLLTHVERETIQGLPDPKACFGVPIIGVAGAFETLMGMEKLANSFDELESYNGESIQRDRMLHWINHFLGSTQEERANFPCMRPIRVEKILYSLAHKQVFVKYGKTPTFYYSDYALKEGAVLMMAKGLDPWKEYPI